MHNDVTTKASDAQLVSTAVANPAPGSPIQPGTPISLTFNKTVQQALGADRPPVSPRTAGTWHTVNSHTIVFRPEGYGYGLGAHVSIALPHDVRLVGGAQAGTSAAGRWTVPPGSTLRLQQLLATLGYLPLQFKPRDAAPAMTPSGIPSTVAISSAAAVSSKVAGRRCRIADIH